MGGPFEYLGDIQYPDGTPLYNFVQSKLLGRSIAEIKATKPSILSCAVVELDEDMRTVKTEPKAVLDSKTTAPKNSELYHHAFYEAPSIRKIGDTYYLVYSSGENNELAYATSCCPDWGFTYRGVIVSNSDLGRLGLGKPQTQPRITEIGGETIVADMADGTQLCYKYFSFCNIGGVKITFRSSGTGNVEIEAGAYVGKIPVAPCDEWTEAACAESLPDGVSALTVRYRGSGKLDLKEITFLEAQHGKAEISKGFSLGRSGGFRPDRGWLSEAIAPLFRDYVKVVVEALSDRVKWWITINGPGCFIMNGYMQGVHAPFQRDYLALSKLSRNCMLAHAEAVKVLRQYARQPVKVGAAFSTGAYVPQNETPDAIEKARRQSTETGNGLLVRGYRFSGIGNDHACQMLRTDVCEHVKLAHDELGIRYIRFRGLHRSEAPVDARKRAGKLRENREDHQSPFTADLRYLPVPAEYGHLEQHPKKCFRACGSHEYFRRNITCVFLCVSDFPLGACSGIRQ